MTASSPPETSTATPTTGERYPFQTITTTALVLLLAAIATRSFLTSSLWLDETISAWVTESSLEVALERSVTYQGQSPFYFALLWWWRQGFGPSELALRALSVLFLLISGVLVWRIALRLLSRDGAWVSVFMLFTFDDVLLAACARPYGLALACSLASILCVMRWCETQKISDGLWYLGTTLATLYAHYLFGLVLVVHLTYVFMTSPQLLRSHRRQIVWGCAIGALLAVPALLQIISLSARRETLYFAVRPSLLALLKDLMPPPTLVCLACALVMTRIQFSDLRVSTAPAVNQRITRNTCLVILLVWQVVPPLVFFLLSTFGKGSLALSRLYLWHTPALALLVALLVTGLSPAGAKRWCFSVIALLAIFRECGHTWQVEDWRGAAAYIRSQVPADEEVLVYSGLVELQQPEWLVTPQRWPYLLAPLSHYTIANHTTPISADMRSERYQPIFNSTIKPLLDSRNALTVITLDQRLPNGTPRDTIIETLTPLGFSPKNTREFGRVIVTQLAR